MSSETPSVPRHARGKRPQFYDSPGLDHAMSMILVLASELMVVRDRLETVEKIAEKKGVLVDEEIDAYRPSPEEREKRESRRQAFLDRLYYVARKESAELGGADTAERYSRALEEIAQS